MAERTAAEILYAQLDLEVATAKAVFDERLGADIETLAEAVCRRWWISRMTHRHELPVDVTDLHERMNHRMNALAAATQAIVQRSGAVDPNSLQMSVLGISAEVNAVWGALIEAGLMTPANRQDYMDAAVSDLYKRVQDSCQQIVMPGGGRAS